MPKPRYEKTTYNDIRQPGLEQVPHVPKAPPGPFCNKQSVKDYREKIMPDWFEKVTEEHDKGQRLKQGQARYARDDGSPSGTPKDKTRSFKIVEKRGPGGSTRRLGPTDFAQSRVFEGPKGGTKNLGSVGFACSCVCEGPGGGTRRFSPMAFAQSRMFGGPKGGTKKLSSVGFACSHACEGPEAGTRKIGSVDLACSHQCGGQGAALWQCPALACYYRQYARDRGICQSFVPLLHTMQKSCCLRAPQLSTQRVPPSPHSSAACTSSCRYSR